MRGRYAFVDETRPEKPEAVAIVLSTIYPRLYEIDLLEVRPRTFCGLGLGTKVMEEITRDADREDIILQLVEVPDYTKAEALRRFYMKFGFKEAEAPKPWAILRRVPR